MITVMMWMATVAPKLEAMRLLAAGEDWWVGAWGSGVTVEAEIKGREATKVRRE